MSDPQSLPRHKRAAHYREQAEKLRQMAEREQPGPLRNSLANAADEYDKLAASLDARKHRPF